MTLIFRALWFIVAQKNGVRAVSVQKIFKHNVFGASRILGFKSSIIPDMHLVI